MAEKNQKSWRRDAADVQASAQLILTHYATSPTRCGDINCLTKAIDTAENFVTLSTDANPMSYLDIVDMAEALLYLVAQGDAIKHYGNQLLK